MAKIVITLIIFPPAALILLTLAALARWAIA